MARQSWVVDSSRIATKIRSASASHDSQKVEWKSNPTKSCPNCQCTIDNSEVAHEWPGLPRGVKFDPSDQEIIWHLLAKVDDFKSKPHPFIDEFIPTVDEEEGICYTHPRNLPGAKQDGSVSHFFHRAIKAYNTGTRKRRKILGDDLGDVRWHKTGRTKPVFVDGSQIGCKKIMVLYMSPVRGGKAEKTNWVMHQYHLGTGEDEREGEFVLSKVFYQQQQVKLGEKNEEIVDDDVIFNKVDPVTPKLMIPEPAFADKAGQDSTLHNIQQDNISMEDELEAPSEQSNNRNHENLEILLDQEDEDKVDEEDGSGEDNKWWENESQFLLSSQQLVEGLSLCDELLQSQSPNRDENVEDQIVNNKPRLSDYSRLGPEDLKRDLELCQNLATDLENIETDTPPDFRLSQLEFESQDSYIAWGGSAKGYNGLD